MPALRVLPHPEHPGVEIDLIHRQQGVGVDLVDRVAVVLDIARSDPDVSSRGTDREQEIAPRDEGGREGGSGAAGDVLRHAAQLQALGVEHDGIRGAEVRLDPRYYSRLIVSREGELRRYSR